MKKSLNHLDSPVNGIRGVDGGPQNCHGATMDHTYIQVTKNWKKKWFVRLKKGVQKHMHYNMHSLKQKSQLCRFIISKKFPFLTFKKLKYILKYVDRIM